MRAFHLALVLALGVGGAAAGCGGSGEGAGSAVDVVLDRSSTTPGGQIKARVRNESGDLVSYGLAYRLSRETGDGFSPVDLPDRAVIQIALVADPGETGPPVTVEIPADAEPGTWRVSLGGPGSGLDAEFDVAEPSSG